jgi:hypothetical protein
VRDRTTTSLDTVREAGLLASLAWFQWLIEERLSALELLPEPPVVAVLHLHPRALAWPVWLGAFLRDDPLEAMPTRRV